MLLSLVLACSSYARAQEREHLIIGTNIEGSPFVLNAEKLTGHDAELLQTLFLKLNFEITMIRAPSIGYPSY